MHVQFYLNLLDTYVPDETERFEAFAAIENIPSIRRKAEFCFRWIDSLSDLRELRTREDRRAFLLNLICFAACIEGLFFYGAFAYVYFLRSRGLLHGLASGTNWVFRDESMHMAFAFDVVDTVRAEEPDLFDDELADQVRARCSPRRSSARCSSPRTCCGQGVSGMSLADMREYLQHVADRRLAQLGIAPHVRVEPNPFALHGAAGRAGAVQLLRAAGVGLPGRGDRHRHLRRRLLGGSRGPRVATPRPRRSCSFGRRYARNAHLCRDRKCKIAGKGRSSHVDHGVVVPDLVLCRHFVTHHNSMIDEAVRGRGWGAAPSTTTSRRRPIRGPGVAW